MTFAFSLSRAPRTTELYQSVWFDFTEFCTQIDARPLPATAETVLEFLRAREPTHSNSALGARRSAIVAAHKDARSKLPKAKRGPYMLDSDDAFKLGWKEISRRKGNRHTPREAIGAEKLKRILIEVPNTPTGVMDRAILLLGLVCLLRRSEVAALNRDDIEFNEDGMLVHVRRSKTDQNGIGVTLAAARSQTPETCPVAAMERWLAQSKIEAGPLFQHPKFKERKRISMRYPYDVIKSYGKKAGLDPKPLGFHSLRRGGITEIHEANIDAKSGMQLSRHRTPHIYFSYIADKEAQKNPAVTALARAL